MGGVFGRMRASIHPYNAVLCHPRDMMAPCDDLLSLRIVLRCQPDIEAGTTRHIVRRMRTALPLGKSQKRRRISLRPIARGLVDGQRAVIAEIRSKTALILIVMNSAGPLAR